ncbi:MAG TPA: phosphoribosylglycinamide formyltransferase [Bacteroidota bacterium]|nr:phosphoribosylglycinamide formyltransferase [Bacteroidota bacterium]
MLKIAVFASGKGSNLAAILDAVAGGRIPDAGVVLVVSNNHGAGALAMAGNRGIPALHISRRMFPTDEAYNESLLAALNDHQVNFIALAGYMKKLDAPIVRSFINRIVNIHPALLPAFGGEGMYGMHVHRAVIASGSRISGATVHLVNEEYDAGPIILQEQIPVDPGETAESLAGKVLALEHRLYPEAIRLFAEGRISVDRHHRVAIAS